MAKRIRFAEIDHHIKNRDQFIDPDAHQKILADIVKRNDLYFLPNDVREKYDNVGEIGKYKFEYRYYLFGILSSGAKACVILNNIKIACETMVPDGKDPNKYLTQLQEHFVDKQIDYSKMELTRGYPLKGFRKQAADWIRIQFCKLADRNKALTHLATRNTNLGNKEREGGDGLSTAVDDTGGRDTYFRILAREYKFNTCSWNKLPAGMYNRTTNSQSTLDYVFIINIENLTPISDADIDTLGLTKDKTLVMKWDIETYKYNDTGEAPDHKDTDYIIFMICMNFYWQYSADALLNVCIVDMSTGTNEVDKLKLKGKTYIIECNSREAVLDAVIKIWSKMKPDISDAFNGGNFDTLLLREEFSRHSMLRRFISGTSSLKLTDYDLRPPFVKRSAKSDDEPQLGKDPVYNNFYSKVKVKISADEDCHLTIHTIPGTIDTDSMIIFKQLYPRAEVGRNQSLNYYLSKNKLGSKEDLPYKRMFRIYEMSRCISMVNRCNPCSKKISTILLSQSETPILRNVIEDLKAYCTKWYPDMDADHICICKWKEFLQNEMSLVARYCLIDAHRLQQLNLVRTTINDKRELSNMSFLSLYDSYYKANGMKVRNLIAAVGYEHGIKVSNARVNNQKIKYPGAWVFPPQKGLENKRPVTGLDFSSLYPSLMMTYNFSPDKFIRDKESADKLIAEGYILHHISFDCDGSQHEADHLANVENYLATYTTNGKVNIQGWTVRHQGIMQPVCGCKDCLNGTGTCLAGLKTVVDYEKEGGEYKRAGGKRIPIYGRPALPGETFGIGSYVLKHLFDRRAVIKKRFVALTILKEKMEKGDDVTDAELLNVGMTRDELSIHELEFRIATTDSKQKAMKVHMNTFYGENGNSESPLYILPIAGGVTSAGQYNIKRVEAYLKDHKYKIHYGDTDSVYISCPDSIFEAIDAEYKQSIEGIIDPAELTKLKVAYWTKLVRSTRTEINKLKIIVGDHLTKDNLTEFLNMAYEEVLFPVVFAGKKKYFGYQHLDSENFFPEDKDIFIRGIDIIKQGQSNLARTIGYETIRQILSIDNNMELIDIVKGKIDEIYNKQWDLKYFIMSAKYKPEKKNVPIQTFIKRMTDMRNRHPDKAALYYLPEPGDPFKYVIIKRDEIYDTKGKRIDAKKGTVMEYVDVFLHSKEIGKEMEIDLNYYFDGAILGLLSRFISSEPQFAPTEIMEYSVADKYIQKQAEKYLESYRNNLIGFDASRVNKLGREYRSLFKSVNNIIKSNLSRKIGSASTLLYDIDLTYDDAETLNVNITIQRIEEHIKNTCSRSNAPEIFAQLMKLHIPFKQLYDIYVIGKLSGKRTLRASSLKLRQIRMADRMKRILNDMRECVSQLPTIAYDYKLGIDNIIYEYRSEINAGDFNTIDSNYIEQVNNFDDDTVSLLQKIYNLYTDYYVAYKLFKEAEELTELFRARYDAICGYHSEPAKGSASYPIIEETPFV